MRYAIRHTTSYRYSEPASLSQNELFLQPRYTVSQSIEESRLVITPEPQYLRDRLDYFSNICHIFMVQHPHEKLQIESLSIVRTQAQSIPQVSATLPWEQAAALTASPATAIELEAYQFVFASPLIELFDGAKEYVLPSFPAGQPVLAGAIDLIARIYSEFAYDKNATTVDTSVDQILVKRKGVCQDFAHLAIGCLRSLGLAARYVSGYLETMPPPGKPKLVGADASHAWLSLYIPAVGWVDLDPTNNMLPAEQHVTLAWGRDYGDVTPVKGVVMGGGNHKLHVSVDMSALP